MNNSLLQPFYTKNEIYTDYRDIDINIYSYMQRISAKRKGTGVEKCGMRTAFDASPTCFPSKFKTKA
jgi:hypothetical protein